MESYGNYRSKQDYINENRQRLFIYSGITTVRATISCVLAEMQRQAEECESLMVGKREGCRGALETVGC